MAINNRTFRKGRGVGAGEEGREAVRKNEKRN